MYSYYEQVLLSSMDQEVLITVDTPVNRDTRIWTKVYILSDNDTGTPDFHFVGSLVISPKIEALEMFM